MHGYILIAKITSLFLAIVFGFLYFETKSGSANPQEITTILEGTDKSKHARYLVFSGKSHPLPVTLHLDGRELFYRLKKGDEIRVATDTNGFVASLHVYGVQVLTLDDYAAWKERRTERWLITALSFLAGFMFLRILELRKIND